MVYFPDNSFFRFGVGLVEVESENLRIIWSYGRVDVLEYVEDYLFRGFLSYFVDVNL